MRRANVVVSVLVQLALASSLASTVLPAAAATYTPGVSAGNHVTYGTVTASYSSNVSGTPTPQFIFDIKNTTSVRIDYQSVSGNNVTEKVTQNLGNQTSPKIQNVNWDVQNLQGNVSSSNGFGFATFPFLFAGGLSQGDHACGATGTGTMCTPTINQTLTARTYAGAPRDVNQIVLTTTSSSTNTSTTVYWDKSTGALVDASFSITSAYSHQRSTYSFGVTATETSLWSATIFGLAPLVFYGIIGAIVAIIVIVAAVMLMRMRKPKTPAMPATAPPPGP